MSAPAPRKTTIVLRIHGQVVQTVPMDRQDIEAMLEALRQAPRTPRNDRLIDLLQQVLDRTS